MKIRTFFKRLFLPEFPASTDKIQQRSARILNFLLILTVLLTITSGILQGLYGPPDHHSFILLFTTAETAIGLALLFWLRRGGLRPVSRLVVFSAYLASTYPLAAYADISVGPAVFAYLVVIGLSILLLSPWEIAGMLGLIAITFPILQMGIDSGALTPSLSLPNPRSVISSYYVILGIGGAALTLATYNLQISLRQEKESLQAAERANRELQTINTNLENIIRERTHTLEEQTAHLQRISREAEKRSHQLEAVAQVIRASLQTADDVHSLLTHIANLIHQHFGFYHVGIFLLDTTNRYAVLQAVNEQSPGGQAMLSRQHKLFVGQTGIVGAVAASGLPRIISETAGDAIYFDNPDLPETRSEIALPLIVRRRVIGVLDIQSTESNAFTEDDLHIFNIMADQIAQAIYQSQRLQEAERLAREASLVYSDALLKGWQRLAKRHQVLGVQRRAGFKTFIGKPQEYPPDIQQALQAGEQVRQPIPNGERLLIPIRLREQTVGVMEIQAATISEDVLNITANLAERVALAVENIRLLEEAQERAERERRISNFSAQISTSVNVQNILRIAAEEIGQFLPGAEVTIQVTAPKDGTQNG